MLGTNIKWQVDMRAVITATLLIKARRFDLMLLRFRPAPVLPLLLLMVLVVLGPCDSTV